MKLTEVKQIVDKATQDGVPAFFKNLIPATPSWDQFLNHFNYQLNKGPAMKIMNPAPEYKILNGVLKKNDFYYQVRDVVNEPWKSRNFFPEINELKNLFDVIYQENAWGGTSFINFSSNEPDVPTHEDAWVNVHWQCQGSTVWETRASSEDVEPLFVYKMDPGDVIVVPTGVQHAVSHIMPRAGIVLSYQFKDSPNRTKEANEKGNHMPRPFVAPEGYEWE